MKNDVGYLKKQNILDHSNNPRNYGVLEECDFVSGEYNPSCGDSVMICGKIAEHKLQEVRFEGKGCVLSIAMASMLTEHVKEMLLEDILRLDDSLVSNLLGVELGINRLQCGTLSIMALQKGLKNYKDKS